MLVTVMLENMLPISVKLINVLLPQSLTVCTILMIFLNVIPVMTPLLVKELIMLLMPVVQLTKYLEPMMLVVLMMNV